MNIRKEFTKRHTKENMSSTLLKWARSFEKMDCKLPNSLSSISLMHARFEMPFKMESRKLSWHKLMNKERSQYRNK